VKTAKIDLDEVMASQDGYTILVWARCAATLKGPWSFPDGTGIDCTGRTVKDLRYAYKLAFSPVTNKAIKFEGLSDFLDWARLADLPALAGAMANCPMYDLANSEPGSPVSSESR